MFEKGKVYKKLSNTTLQENNSFFKSGAVYSGSYTEEKTAEALLPSISDVIKSGGRAVTNNKGFEAYVKGNPIPHVNPLKSLEGRNADAEKAAEDYAKQVTKGDGFEDLSLSELKEKMNLADTRRKEAVQGENFVQTALNTAISKVGAIPLASVRNEEYEAIKSAYEKRNAAYNKYKLSQKYNTESGDEIIAVLEKQKKEAKSKNEEDIISNEIKTARQSFYGEGNLGEYLFNNFDAGAAMFNKSLSATADFTLGRIFKTFGWENNPISKWNNFHGDMLESSAERANNSAKAIGDDSNIGGQFIQATVNALPDAILAVATGGNNVATKLGTIGSTVISSIKTMVKNPAYWTSFSRELGSGYEEALKNGATDIEATAYALLSSTWNSVVEIGGATGNGGIQSLPEALENTFGKKGLLLKWVKSMFEEGNEEVVQGIISLLTEKAIYNKEKEIYSNTDETAIINPKRMANEFAMGAAVGGVLGGGQITFSSIINSKNTNDYKAFGKEAKAAKDIQGIIDYASNSVDTDIRALAIKSKSDNISDETAGRLYAYVCRDINQAINTPEDINIALENFNSITENIESPFVNGIATSQILNRLIETGLDNDTAVRSISHNEQENNNSVLQNGDNSDIMLKKEGEGYARTNEFRDLQAEVQGMPDEVKEMYHSGSRTLDDGLRERFSRSVRGLFLDTRNNVISNGNGVLTLTDKKSGNKFNIHQQVNGELFHDVFEMARSYLKYGELVDLHGVETTEDSIGYDDCTNYLSEDGLSGFSITPDGDLISVFNASGRKGFLRAISDIVKQNAITLDCYASKPNQDLEAIYSVIFGFKTASSMDYNMEYDHDNIAENHGMPQIAFMVNSNNEVETKYFTADQYDEAKEYRDNFIKDKADSNNESAFSLQEEEELPKPDSEIYNLSKNILPSTENKINRKQLTLAEKQTTKTAGEALGKNVVFFAAEKYRSERGLSADARVPEGFTDGNTIYICEAVINPLAVLFAHEFTDSVTMRYISKDAKGNTVFTEEFEKLINKALKSKAFLSFANSNGFKTVDSFVYATILDRTDAGDTNFVGKETEEAKGQARIELFSDFIASTLTSDVKSLEDFANRMNAQQKKTFITVLRDLIAMLKSKLLSGLTGNRKYIFEYEINQIEKKLAKLYQQSISSQKDNTPDDGGVRFSISENFQKTLNNWDKKTVGFSFIVGNTSKVLENAGIPNKQIRLDATKVKALLEKHSGMTIETISKIPELLENPIFVIDSKSNKNSKIIMGDLYDENGKIVTVVLLLTPTSKKGNQLDIIKISSAEGRSHIESLFKNTDGSNVTVRYVDKKRVRDWLNVNRLQLPLHSFNLNSNNSIHNKNAAVNSNYSPALTSR